ncbi:hypothetical protein EJ07DRAFT_168767 [Lizonia empirigonia]|nr:hypothetical protein EJ07DRAFT_168767 [Lizonia empirigonia]
MPTSSPHSQRSPTEIQNLFNVIDSATPHRLRTLLNELSTTTPAIFVHIQGKLMLQSGALKRAWSDHGEDEDEDDEDNNGLDGHDGEGEDDTSEDAGHDFESDYSDKQTNAPASRQRYEICGPFHEEYNDGDFWADHDKHCHGAINTPEIRKKHRQGFVWECCDALGSAAGCKTSRHRPNRTKRVRR